MAAHRPNAADRSVMSSGALELSLQKQDGICRWQACQRQAAHFTPQAPLARHHDECCSRRDIEHLFELVQAQMDIVEEDERALVLKAAPDLSFSRFTELAALVESFEEELLEIEGRLMPCR